MRSQPGQGRYLGALAGPLMLAGLLTTGLGPAAAVPACQTWTAVPPLNPGTQDNELESVNVLSGSDAWAVGVSHDAGPEQTLTEHWNGSSWSVVPSPDPGGGNNSLFAVRGASPDDVWAVGNFEDTSGPSAVAKTLILHWDGTMWSQVTSPSPGKEFNELNAVRVVSASDVWAVGSFSSGGGSTRSLILHWNGTVWKRVTSPNPAIVNNLSWVTSTSSTDVWAVGLLSNSTNLTRRPLTPGTHIGASADPKTFIVHWNGTKWSQVASPSPGSFDFLQGVGATSTSNAWAVGTTSANRSNDQTLIMHWNGTAWKRVTSPNPGGSSADNELSGLATTATNNAWAVGSFDDSSNNQQAFIARWDGSSWQQVQISTTGTSSALFGVGASSSGNAWAVGSDVSGTTGQTLALHCS
jgi:hypothetical protein